METEIKYLNAYLVCRAYGGPEEGGWWYDRGRLLASVPLSDPTPEQIEKEKRNLKEIYEGFNSGNCELEIQLESKTGEDFPQERPRYA